MLFNFIFCFSELKMNTLSSTCHQRWCYSKGLWVISSPRHQIQLTSSHQPSINLPTVHRDTNANNDFITEIFSLIDTISARRGWPNHRMTLGMFTASRFKLTSSSNLFGWHPSGDISVDTLFLRGRAITALHSDPSRLQSTSEGRTSLQNSATGDLTFAYITQCLSSIKVYLRAASHSICICSFFEPRWSTSESSFSHHWTSCRLVIHAYG